MTDPLRITEDGVELIVDNEPPIEVEADDVLVIAEDGVTLRAVEVDS